MDDIKYLKDFINLNSLQLKDGDVIIYDDYDIKNYLKRYNYFYCFDDINDDWEFYSKVKWLDYLKVYKAWQMIYNPIHNYDRDELEYLTKDEGKTTVTNTPNQTDTTTMPAVTTSNNYTTTYDDVSKDRLTDYTVNKIGNDNNYTTTTTSEGQNVSETVHAKESKELNNLIKETITGDRIDVRHNVTQGNIGVTTTQRMLQSELDLRKQNLLALFLDDFVYNTCWRGGSVSDYELNIIY